MSEHLHSSLAGPTQKWALKTRKQEKARRDRREAKVIKAVRTKCVERDGYCKLAQLGGCGGPSEWAHLGEWRRCFTRGRPPEDRHHTKGSFMACARHHRAYDSGHFEVLYGEQGANGKLTIMQFPKGRYEMQARRQA